MTGEGWTLVRIGDAGLQMRHVRQEIDPSLHRRVLRLAEAVRVRRDEGVRDVVESYCAVTVHFDPLRTEVDQLNASLGQVIADEGRWATPVSDRPDRVVTIPVRYGGEDGPDLAAVADRVGCTEAEVVELHASETYRVYMLGFLPGFAYMGLLAPPLEMPRRAVPRVVVPSGAVGIAGRQTGVYPMAAPGGWHLIGRTDVRPFDLSRDDPFLFKPGDTVCFEPVETPARVG